MELIRLESICKAYRRGDLEIPVLQAFPCALSAESSLHSLASAAPAEHLE